MYLVARDYLVSYQPTHGRVFDRNKWITLLPGKYLIEEHLCQLAALNHGANYDELIVAYQEQFLEVVAPVAAEAIRRVVADGIDGRTRVVPGASGCPVRDPAGSDSTQDGQNPGSRPHAGGRLRRH